MRIQRISENDFATIREEWQALLAQSPCDPLFMSWDWMFTWWTTYGTTQNNQLEILIARDEKESLLGIAPLYIHTHKISGIPFSIRSVLFVGTARKSYSGFLTENLEFIAASEHVTNFATAVFEHLQRHYSFDELYLAFTPTDTPTYQAAMQLTTVMAAYTRIQYNSHSYWINTHQDFSQYLNNLGKNTRLKVFNRRKNLEKLGNLAVKYEGDFSHLLPLLAKLHEKRWNKKPDFTLYLKFINSLLTYGQIKTTGLIITLDDAPIACTLDIICETRAYNLQLGFEDYSQHKIATGSLALGYAIEIYCQNAQVKHYDLLVGEGKNSNYKESLTPHARRIESVQIICSTRVKLMFKMKDLLAELKKRYSK